MQASGRETLESGRQGAWTYSLTDPSGAVVAEGQGFWQGAPAPLDLPATTG